MAFFTQWFPTVFLPHVSSKEGTKEMIGESLGSHFSPEIMKLTKEHDIKFITLHPNSSHLFQPLVVAVFKITEGQLESYSRFMEEGNKIKWSFSRGTSLLLVHLCRGLKANHLASGLKGTGIFFAEL